MLLIVIRLVKSSKIRLVELRSIYTERDSERLNKTN